jgi:hypothetical protein
VRGRQLPTGISTRMDQNIARDLRFDMASKVLDALSVPAVLYGGICQAAFTMSWPLGNPLNRLDVLCRCQCLRLARRETTTLRTM